MGDATEAGGVSSRRNRAGRVGPGLAIGAAAPGAGRSDGLGCARGRLAALLVRREAGLGCATADNGAVAEAGGGDGGEDAAGGGGGGGAGAGAGPGAAGGRDPAAAAAFLLGPNADPAMALLAEHLLKPLPADKQIETGPFLDAVAHLPPFFDCFGSPVFTPIKADISGNIKTIRAVYDTDPAKFRTLQNILEVEKEMYGADWPKVGATLALMWLKRGLRFIQVLLQSICDGERDENRPNLIRVNVTKAYEMALKKYHGWLVQKIFQGALYAAPYKSDFLKALSKGQDVPEDQCLEKVRLFLVNFTATIDIIYEMYTKMNAELNYKV